MAFNGLIFATDKDKVLQYKDLIQETRKPLTAGLTSMTRRNSRVELYAA